MEKFIDQLDEEIENQIKSRGVKGYLLEKFLAKGSYGAVFKCTEDKDGGLVYAMKIVCKNDLEDKEERERLQLEIETMQKLDHINLIKCYDFFEDSEFYYIVQDFCDGGDLDDVLNKAPQNQLKEPVAVNYLKQIANGFKVLHKKCIMHRDVKPANLLLKGDIIKIADFGLLKVSYRSSDLTASLVGTDNYQAAEIIRQRFGPKAERKKNFYYNNKVDLFSIGVVFYQMLYGTTLIDLYWEDYELHVNHYAKLLDIAQNKCGKNLKFSRARVSHEAKNFLISMTEPDPEERLSWEQFFTHKLFKGDSNLGPSSEVNFYTFGNESGVLIPSQQNQPNNPRNPDLFYNFGDLNLGNNNAPNPENELLDSFTRQMMELKDVDGLEDSTTRQMMELKDVDGLEDSTTRALRELTSSEPQINPKATEDEPATDDTNKKCNEEQVIKKNENFDDDIAKLFDMNFDNEDHMKIYNGLETNGKLLVMHQKTNKSIFNSVNFNNPLPRAESNNLDLNVKDMKMDAKWLETDLDSPGAPKRVQSFNLTASNMLKQRTVARIDSDELKAANKKSKLENKSPDSEKNHKNQNLKKSTLIKSNNRMLASTWLKKSMLEPQDELDFGKKFVDLVTMQIINRKKSDKKAKYLIKNALKVFYLMPDETCPYFIEAASTTFAKPMQYPENINFSLRHKKQDHEIKTITFLAMTSHHVLGLSSIDDRLPFISKEREILAGCLLLKKALMMNKAIQNFIQVEYIKNNDKDINDQMILDNIKIYTENPEKIEALVIQKFIADLKENELFLQNMKSRTISIVNTSLEAFKNEPNETFENQSVSKLEIDNPIQDFYANPQKLNAFLEEKFKKIDSKQNEMILFTIEIFQRIFDNPEAEKNQDRKHLQMKVVLCLAKVYMCKHYESFFGFVDKSFGYFDWNIFQIKFNAKFVKKVFLLAV